MDEILIDGSEHPNYGPVWGTLEGWHEEPGCWETVLFSKDGIRRFRSSKPDSAETVAKVIEILRGDNGLQPKTWDLELRDGVLVISREEPLEPPVAAATYPSMGEVEPGATELLEIFGSRRALADSLKTLADQGGPAVLIGRRKLMLAEGVTLAWSHELEPVDLEALAIAYRNGSCAIEQWSEAEWISLRREFPDSSNRLSSLRLELNPPPGLRTARSFHAFEMGGFFDHTFRTLFCTPSWVVEKLARDIQPALAVYPEKFTADLKGRTR